MTWWQALLLGLVEGITEFLPVSSTGHLIVAQRALGIPQGDAADAYAIAIQAGAILAVLGLYRDRVAQALRGLAGRDPAGRQLVVALVVAFVPFVAIAAPLGSTIKKALFGPWPVVAAWLVGGALILALARSPKLAPARAAATTAPTGGPEPAAVPPAKAERPPLDITTRQALIIGLCQCAALWPGTSRSLATILGAVLLAGLPLGAAVEFSFLLGVLTLGAATAKEVLDHGRTLVDSYGAGTIAAGVVTAWLSAVLAVRFMVEWLQRRGLALFGWWRLLLGVVVGGATAAGLMG